MNLCLSCDSPNLKYKKISFDESQKYPICFVKNWSKEQYKYKKIEKIIECFVVFPKPNKEIIFDETYFYKELTEKKSNIEIFEFDNENKESLSSLLPSNTIEINCLKLDSLLYDNDFEYLEGQDSVIKILHNKVIDDTTIQIKGDELQQLFGTTDFHPFFLKEIPLTENNRFYRRKLYKNALPLEVCYWMINHYLIKEKYNSSSSNKYILYIKDVPSLEDYCNYSIDFLINKIKKDYDMNSVNLTIQDMFIKKYSGEIDKTEKEDTFFILEFLLNDRIDFMSNSLLLNQGEVLVSTPLNHDKNCIDTGTAYIFTVLVKIVI